MNYLTVFEKEISTGRNFEDDIQAFLIRAKRAVNNKEIVEIEEKALFHYYTDTEYIRELFIPKGMLIIGKKHKTRHSNIIAEGKIIVKTENFQYTYEAPSVFISDAGERKVVYALEDTTFITVHNKVRNETLKSLEKRLVEKEHIEHNKLGEIL